MEDPYNFVDEEDPLVKPPIPQQSGVGNGPPMMMTSSSNGPPLNHQQPQHPQNLYNNVPPQMQNHAYSVMPNNNSLEKPIKKRGRKKKCDELR